MKTDRNPAVANLDDASRARPAGDVLADVPWGVDEEASPDPRQLSAAQFLSRLADE